MARRGTPFVGVLYCGLALTSRGVRVIEFNARFGDPETQAVLARLATPLGRAAARLLHRVARRRRAPWSGAKRYAADVVIAARDYPESPRRGDVITGTRRGREPRGRGSAARRHRADGQGRLTTSGGRVLAVVGTGVYAGRGRGARLRRGAADLLARRAAPHRHRRQGARRRDPAQPRDAARRRHAGQRRRSAPRRDREELPGWVHVSSGKVRELYRPDPDHPGTVRTWSCGRQRPDQRL